MAVTVGRVSLDDTNNWSISGDEVSLSTEIIATTSNAAKALRQQLLGLFDNPDEPVVPVTFSEDSDADGFYEVTSVAVDTFPVSLSSNTFPVELSLRRLPGYALPWGNSILLGAVRNNNHTISSAAAGSAYWHAIPSDTLDYYLSTSTDTNTAAASTGSVSIENIASASWSGSAVAKYTIKPSDWYDGAAKIEYARSGTYYTVVGRNVESGLDATGWRVSNGIIRLSSSSGTLMLEANRAGTWGTAKGFKANLYTTYTSFSVLRNSVEEAVVRVGMAGVFGSQPPAVLDIRLRRGAAMAECSITDLSAGTNLGTVTASICRTTTEAGTNVAIGGTVVGIAANAADADGNSYVLITSRTNSRDTTNGTVGATTPTNRFPFGLGISTGTVAYTGATQAELISRYFWPLAERVSIVAH